MKKGELTLHKIDQLMTSDSKNMYNKICTSKIRF